MASHKFPVAVIGTAVRLPGARNCEEFWQLMLNGKDTVAEFPQERASDIDHVLAAFRDQLVDEENPFFTGSFFQSIDQFDPDLFQINPREALFIEPEQRIFLETVWELLEDAGYASKIKGSQTGVYVGNTVNKYKYILNENHPSISHGNHSPFISSRVSYTHDLHGPAMMVATGCSSSLLAVHLACQGLLSGDCEMAIAGGITLDLLPISTKTDIWNQLGITGPNVKCRAFDASAKGIAKGEGCGVILLKPLQNAINDGDHIYGVLEATTANQDGHSNGITAPHPVAQANMLHQAWKLADIQPNSLGFFEAHGTGTELGDPIEISGITNAFRMSGTKTLPDNNKIPIGSVKANIGHLADGAAGIVGLIKALLCLNKNKIPGAINFTKPNPHINWKKSPVFVNSSTLDWFSNNDIPRYASVSAFGLLGTNIHAVVKEYKTSNKIQNDLVSKTKPHIICIAANSLKSLQQFTGRLLTFLENVEDKSYQMLHNICYSINSGREQARFHYRAILVNNTWEDTISSLELLCHGLRDNEFDCATATGFAVSVQEVIRINTIDESNMQTTTESRLVMEFLKGVKVNWKDVYQDINEVQRIPLIPTYVFDQVRLWPTIENPINKELLKLEHKCMSSTDYHGFCSENADNSSIEPKELQNTVEDLLQTSLNDALNTQHDWENIGNENLFLLGMDSLIFTQVSMTLKASVGFGLSMANFHKNPTYNGLVNIATNHRRVNGQRKRETLKDTLVHSPTQRCDVKCSLETALNEAFGQDVDWSSQSATNLFTLGLDSLIYTHVNMKLKDMTKLETPITMTELHENPTFNSLQEIIEAKLSKFTSYVPEKGEKAKMEDTDSDKESESHPISFAQRRLWVMQEMVSNPSAYNATNCLKLKGDFHPKAFRQALERVLENNVTFYTIFENKENGPLQKIDRTLDLSLREINLRRIIGDADDEAMKLYDQDYRTPFNLTNGPLVRCTLYHLPNNSYYYTMVVHHIIFDGWSHFVFYNELWATYKTICQGQNTPDSVKQIRYVDIAKEEVINACLPCSRISDDMVYWKTKLEGSLPLTTFPGDKKRPPVFTYNGRRITRFISHKLLEDLEQFSKNQHTTFMVLLSTVYGLLKRYTGETDFIIGTPIAGRYDMKYRDVIGCFINTLALRVRLEDDMNFQNILDEVTTVCLEAYDHQQAPFDHLVSQLHLPRDTSITPVFSVNVCYHNTEMKGEHVNPPEELTVERRLLHNDSSKWDMQFDFLHEQEGMRFTLEYYSDLFSDTYAECIVDNFLSLLNGIVECSSTPIHNLQLKPTPGLDEAYFQASLMIGEHMDLGCRNLADLLVDSMRNNESSTLTDKSKSITHRYLLQRVEILSTFLRRACHLEKGTRVAIMMENSTEAIKSILSCFISGLVYVPLDTNSPKSRLEYICSEAKVQAIIFSSPFINIVNHLQWTCSMVKTILCIDAQVFDDIKEVEITPLMNTELWDCVASQADDGIEGGGWKSSYTGEHMSQEEMCEYSNNVFQKLKPYLHTSARVLEIGCASGLTTKMVRPHVGSYVATDLSQEMVNKLADIYKDEPDMDFICAAAHQVANICQYRKFDIIIMNSVIHCFPGYNYLKNVIRNCESLLSEDGIIFIGDIMDMELRDALITSIKAFKTANPEHRTKIDWSNELFVPRKFLRHICATSNKLKSLQHSRKLYSISNELTEYRYDAILTTATGENPCCVSYYNTYAIGDLELSKAEDLTRWFKDISFKDDAYILYTSGTTGTPKGVIISHEALLNYVQWASRTYEFGTDTYTPFFAPLTFDFTVTSIFPPLLKGSNIRIFKNFQDSYQEIANTTNLTIGKFSPLQLDMLLSSRSLPLSIKTYILGGEELTTELLSKLKRNKGEDTFEVWNEYGPTEATVGCVVKCFHSKDLPLPDASLVTIGYPIDNTTVGVMRNNKLVPIGGKGTLAIGGKCLCSDFTGEGESKILKTNKSFRNSIWGHPVERMLMTDDVVEVLPTTHEMAYFGRRDNGSVKINGIRVDMSEVHRSIQTTSSVKSAWVCSFEYEQRTLLGAVVLLKNGKISWKDAIYAEMKEVLPLRSIPNVLVEIFKPPTNANGKVDMTYIRRQCILEMQSTTNATNPVGSLPPVTQELTQLQRIWQSILPINFLPSPSQNFFFDLSGDSLQAIHLVRKMRDEGFKVSVTDIFQNPTIEKLLPNLEKLHDDDICKPEVENIPFKPTPILEEFILNERKYPDYFALSALIDFNDTISKEVLRKALRSVMQKHGSLRSKLYKDNGNVFQEVISLRSDQPKIIVKNFKSHAEHLSDEEEFIEVCEELDQSHSLKDGMVFGAGIFNISYKSGTTKCYGLLVVHHAAIDIVSWQQILEDLAAALKALSLDEDNEPVLKPCKLPFREYCNAVHAESSGIFAPEIEYWIDIENQSHSAGFLLDKDVQSNFNTAKWYSKSIDAMSLRSTSTGLGCSDEQVLLTAFGRSMSTIHGKSKTVLCMESHGRQLDKVDSTDTVGWCTSMFPFILDTPLEGDMLQQVHKVGKAIKDIPNHGLGFGLLKSAGDISMPHSKIMFVFQGSLDASSKETFDGGKFKFDHIPWIEIMLNELRQRRFHRHHDEVLEFDLEIIAWVHSGELKFGCLFDEETISESIVEEIVKRAELNLTTLAERVAKKNVSISLNIIPGFTITPQCGKVIADALRHHHINIEKMTIHQPEEFIQSMYKQTSAAITVVIPRIASKEKESEIRTALQSFEHTSQSSVILMNIENMPNTMCPAFEQYTKNISIHKSHYEESSDAEYNMPISQAGYVYLGLNIARHIKSYFQKTTFKVVAVDGDYTLWDGECANGNISLNQGNLVLQNYLLKLKQEGILLALVSKNEQNDVDNVLSRYSEDMILKKEDFVAVISNWDKKFRNLEHLSTCLNLGLNSFVFIDDNILECEDMLRNLPEVLTLLYPAESELVAPFLDSVWLLDNSIISDEAYSRTDMYREEMQRQTELKISTEEHPETSSIERVLIGWDMELFMVTTTVRQLRQSPVLWSRVGELLHRTNQFKLNDDITDPRTLSDDHNLCITSLHDTHGSYGVISVCVFKEEGERLTVQQWVVSCRALNRQVENRIFYELFQTYDLNMVDMYTNLTKRNTPMINFLKSVDTSLEIDLVPRYCRISNPGTPDKRLHNLRHSSDISEMAATLSTKPDVKKSSFVAAEESSFLEVENVINRTWSPMLLDQASKYSMFPMIPTCKYLIISRLSKTSMGENIKSIWMEVLNCADAPTNNSNFLSSGGTSFAAVFLVTKLQRIHNINIGIMDLLQNARFGDFVAVCLSAVQLDPETEERDETGNNKSLSAAQLRMIIMQESAPESTAYVETVVAYVNHPIQANKIIQKLVKHHPILNLNIVPDVNQGYTVRFHNMDAVVSQEIVSPGEDISEYISRSIPVIQVVASQLSRFRYISAGHRSYIVIHVHHVICDDITLMSIKHSLRNILNDADFGKAKGNTPEDSFCKYEYEYLKSCRFASDARYWKELYSDLPPTEAMGGLVHGSTVWNDSKVYEAKSCIIGLHKTSTDMVSRICTKLQITEFQYYMSCTTIILQHYLGVSEIALAIPVTTRTFQYQHTDGLFVNTVIPRFSVDHRQTLRDNIKRMSQSWLHALNHSQYPLDELARYLWKQHGQSLGTFCAVMFNFLITTLESHVKVPSKHAKLPLSVDVIKDDTTGKVELCVEWANDLISDELVNRIAQSIVEVIGKVEPCIDSLMTEIPTMSASELDMINSFSTSPVEIKIDNRSTIETFEEHVQNQKEKCAVICDDVKLSYSQLDDRANDIAAAILRSVNPSSLKTQPIVLLMKKNEDAIAVILGVWKAGGHFLPVSISNYGCLKDILIRNEPALILTNIENTLHFDQYGETCPVIFVSEIEQDESNCKNEIVITQSVDDLAYIIRTSGSTGQPKQCKITHKSLQTMAASWRKSYAMTAFDVGVFQWAPLSFDVFVGDLIRGLISVCGTLVVCPDDRRLDVSYILRSIVHNKVSLIEVTPQFGQQLVENAQIGDLDSLRILVLGSDVVQTHLFEKIKATLKYDQRLLNSYGMTEATIDSSFFEGDPTITNSGTVPIGKPLPGIQIHIIDSTTLKLCPIGTVGELYLSGDTLASGDVDIVYIESVQQICLKTGDAARWLPSGDVELVGRLDNMMKLRGFRISSTEIEHKIVSTCEGIKAVSVFPVMDKNDVEFLCAFLVLSADNDRSVSKSSICKALRGEVPYYMFPDIVTIIDQIPLTANGKIDRRALPPLQELLKSNINETKIEGKIDCSSPMNTLVKLFAEAMGLSDTNNVDINQTYMEQGGHSLILLRFSSLIKNNTDYEVGIADIFSYPSITALSRYIEETINHTNDMLIPTPLSIPLTENNDIAITGIGLRLPGSIHSLPELWKVLVNGEDLIQDFPTSRKEDVFKCLDSAKASVFSKLDTFKGSFLQHVDQFDNQFFKIAPGEAKSMSPEQRLFLQVATEALGEACNISKVNGSNIGVFVSKSDIGYVDLDHPDDAINISGLMPGMVATRVAYQWDLKGPTMLVDTACSSSLMALKMACESIRNGESDGALVGGANIVLYPGRSGVFGETGILSPDFHCRAFDKDATGTAVGEGVICIYVEPLQSALHEEKTIYGVIKAVSCNSVGHGNGITAPTASSQKIVIETALHQANLEPSDISYIETHGTGTKLGDRIELSALSSIFNHGNSNLPIGAAKCYFGHLDSAAGMIGILKVLASIMFSKIPPMHLFNNPHHELETSSLTVPTEVLQITSDTARPFTAGISSFGLTGTNCHAIIAEHHVQRKTNVENNDSVPLLFVGKDIHQLQQQIIRYIVLIEETIINSHINTISGVCVAVSKRIKNLAVINIGHMDVKVVVYMQSPYQSLKTLQRIQQCHDIAEVSQLAAIRNDIIINTMLDSELDVCCGGVKGFIVNGVVDVDTLYTPGQLEAQAAIGVYLDLFLPLRHWCNPSVSRNIEKEGLMEILQRKITDAREMVRSLPLAATPELRDLEGRFCVAIIIKLLLTTKLGEYLKQNAQISFNRAFKETGMLSKYDKLFYVMIRELYENHVLKATGNDRVIHCLDSFQFQCDHLLDVDPEPIANYAIDKYPSWSDCFRFPLYCSRYLTKVLWGKMSPLSVIYPQGDLNYMYQFDKLGDLIGDVYYNMYMQTIVAFAKELSSQGKKVRVLEVGAGMGHVTRQLIPKLKDTPNIEYWFTDLGKAFVENAKTLFEDYLYMMKFSTFDITKSAPKQGLLGSFDIVISYNVIHTTESVMDSVTNLKSCVGEDGTLFVIESAKNETWATLAWGILDGWWYFKDYDLRPDEPMMEPEKWEKVLKDAGFGSVHSCPVDPFERDQVEKFLFVCSAKSLVGELKQEPGWWETIDLKTRRHQDLEEDVTPSTDTGVEDSLVERDAIHKELKQIWCDLLGFDDIKPTDDFNSLGGESLLAIQMMTLVRKRIGYQLEIADTFGYPTVGALAEYIADRLGDDEDMNESGCSEQWTNLSTPSNMSDVDESGCNHTMLMFPGQGSQKLGMCVSMKESAGAKLLFKRAENVVGYNVLDICVQNGHILEEKLKSTEFVQVALLVGCLAKLEQLKSECPEILNSVTHVSGLSVGEFAALVYANVISFEHAVRIVAVRGRAMEFEVKQSATGMVSVFGPSCDMLQRFIDRKYPSMAISTYLADNQHTVAGTDVDVDKLVADLSGQYKDEMNIIDVRRLRVAGAFHSRYMANASKTVNPVIEFVTFAKPSIPLIMNATGLVVDDPSIIKKLVCEQLVAPVLWKQSVVTAYDAGVTNFLEVAPAPVLSSIVRNRITAVKNCSTDIVVV